MPTVPSYKLLLTGLFIIVFGIALAPVHADAAYSDIVEAEGTLLHYWPMDEAAGAASLAASVGGTALNVTGATAGVPGQTDGTAVSFDGVDDFAATAASLDLSAYSKVVVEALMYVDNYNPTTEMGWEFSINTTAFTNGFYYSPKNGAAPNSNRFAVALRGNAGLNFAQYVQSPAAAWHHVVAVYDKTQSTQEVQLYIDGQLWAAESRPSAFNNSNTFGNHVFYLMSRAGSSFFTPGKVQHLAIYTDLSAARILAHANAADLPEFVPGTLTESSHTQTSATLTWTSARNGAGSIGAQLERSPAGANSWTDVGGATASPAIDTGLSSGTDYDYRVVYTDAGSETIYSNIITVATGNYPEYIADADSVIAGPYDTATAGTPANWGAQLGGSSMEVMVKSQKHRVRQNGTVDKVRLYTVNKTGLSAFYVKIWRKNGQTYDLVGTSNNIAADLVAGAATTVDLATPIAGVMEGDFIGMRVESTGGFNFYAYALGTASSYYTLNASTMPLGENWEGRSVAAAVMPIEVYMQAPQAVFIGDSIISGHNSHNSFLHATGPTDIPSTIERQFSDLTGYTYQNMGIGAQTSTQIAARFTSDVINLRPKIAIIEAGVNDFTSYDPGTSKATFLANWTTMLDAAEASDSIETVLVLKILPWSDGDDQEMQIRDDWNAELTTLAAGYSKAKVVDASMYVGQFRPGGDAGNLWDIQPAYDQDGVHFNAAGHGRIAQALADAFDTTGPVISNIVVDADTTTATITWDTDELASTQLEYGTSNTYGTTTTETDISTRVLQHTVMITGLQPGTTYHFRTLGSDSTGNAGASSDTTFTTDGTTNPGSSNSGSTTSGYNPVQAALYQAQQNAATTEEILNGGQCPAVQAVTQNLKQGSRDGVYHSYTKGVVKDVALVQGHINRILLAQYQQAAGPVDGIFGPLTRQGVVRLQTALRDRLHLDLGPAGTDGIVGPFTRAAINNSCAQ